MTHLHTHIRPLVGALKVVRTAPEILTRWVWWSGHSANNVVKACPPPLILPPCQETGGLVTASKDGPGRRYLCLWRASPCTSPPHKATEKGKESDCYRFPDISKRHFTSPADFSVAVCKAGATYNPILSRPTVVSPTCRQYKDTECSLFRKQWPATALRLTMRHGPLIYTAGWSLGVESFLMEPITGDNQRASMHV